MSSKGEGSEGDGSEHRPEDPGGRGLEYFGWVYHLGVNSIGHEYCHLRFLFLRGRYVSMYKREPQQNPGIQPIRKGVISHTLMVEEQGRRKVNDGEFYVLRFYNRLDETKKGEAFDQAKQQAVYDISSGSSGHKLNIENELNLEGHRPRVRRYAHGLRKLVQIGKGPEMLLRQTSDLGKNVRMNTHFEGDVGDAVEAHEWKCVHTGHGIRIFEDVANSKGGKGILLKSVGVVDASLDTVFEVVLSLDKLKRYEWDILTGDLELVESVDGHYDVVYGTYGHMYLTWWHSKKDFVFSRQWFRAQDGAYIILQFPAIHKKWPPRSGYHRTKINHPLVFTMDSYRVYCKIDKGVVCCVCACQDAGCDVYCANTCYAPALKDPHIQLKDMQVAASVWEIRRLNTSGSSNAKCLVTQMLEIHSSVWSRWKQRYCSNFERTVPFALLCQVAGLREYFGANPALTFDSSSTVVHSNTSDASSAHTEVEDSELKDEFYDAIANDSLEDEDSDEDVELPKAGKMKLKNVSWAIASLALKRSAALTGNSELDANVSPIMIDSSQFCGSLNRGKGETDTNCWTSPSGQGFMIRGKTYLNDYSKVVGGDPLLKLLAVDWLKSGNITDKIALHPSCLVQTEAGKKLPFILIINLQIPSKPNYSLVLYYGADRPIKKDSLLERFVNGTDMFRDPRFKLIPSIIEGYWMVKRAVGSKACLLGKAVTCNYLRQDNYLEIDVDIGSSSVARSIISLVLGYITGIVVDLAILIEAKEEKELPEYILGAVRLNRVKLDSAIQL